VAVSGRRRGSGAKTADQVARGFDGELQDLLDGQGRVERDRDVRQRAQLLDVLVLEPGDLADLAVAAVHALEDRQALAQEVRGRLQRRLRRPVAVAERRAQRRVVGLGEVEHAEMGRDGLAAEVVRGAELALSTRREIGRERSRVGRREIRRSVRATLHHVRKPTR
jgi:hypothetical protein